MKTPLPDLNGNESMLDESILSQLRTIVGQEHLVTDKTNLDIFSSDALSPNRAHNLLNELHILPSAVIFPTSNKQVSEIIKLANLNVIPVTPVGGGTGVMGGIAPLADSLMISLKKMNKLITLDLPSRSVTVEAGMILGELNSLLRTKHHILGHDPYSLPIASVGGAISTNGVGYTASKYGTMGEQVIGLETVLPSGEILPISHIPNSSVGPDVSNLFIGTEGTLGIITAACIKIYPEPKTTRFLTIGFHDFKTGYDLLSEIYNANLRPSLLELSESQNGITMHLVFDGEPDVIDASVKWATTKLDNKQQFLLNPEITSSYWNNRHTSAKLYAHNALNKPRNVKWKRNTNNFFEYLHFSLPPSQILKFKKASERIINQHKLIVTEFSIWGKPDFFSMMIIPAELHSTSTQQLHEASEKLILLSCDMGGSIEYCHGVGIKLKHIVQTELGASYDLIKTLKTTLDPNYIMNPNKYI